MELVLLVLLRLVPLEVTLLCVVLLVPLVL